MDWIITNWETVVGIITAAVTLASLIVKVTPTPKDDAWLAKIVKVLDFIALNKSRKV